MGEKIELVREIQERSFVWEISFKTFMGAEDCRSMKANGRCMGDVAIL